jgi:hypothetical protein
VPGLTARPFDEGSDDDLWDRFVARSVNGTFLHTRRFLSYHGDRFADRSVLIEDGEAGGRAVMPAALDPTDRSVVVSHPGITFGGVVHDGSLAAEELLEVFELMASHYRAGGAGVLRYKAVPLIFHRAPAAGDLYTLHRLGAVRQRCDLSSTVDIEHRLPLRGGRGKRARTARNRGVEARWGWEAAPEFWVLLGRVLGERHGVAPVHSLDEILLLARRFPDEMSLVTTWLDGEMVAGGVTFSMAPTLHLQYSASSPAGRKIGAYDVMVEACVAAAAGSGHRWFDFGISTEDEGRILNASLFDFKASFGAGSVAFEHYEVTL